MKEATMLMQIIILKNAALKAILMYIFDFAIRCAGRIFFYKTKYKIEIDSHTNTFKKKNDNLISQYLNITSFIIPLIYH